ncbi:MAG: substrate-binding domain-containing protein [Chthoniobacterales bacterium]
MEEVFALGRIPRFFYCWDELVALEVFRVLGGMNISIPKEISLVGTRRLPSSPIACVENSLEKMARVAAEQMQIRINGGSPTSSLISPSDFLLRETIADAP